MSNKATIVLASAPPRRADLLKEIGLDFVTAPANVEELEDLSKMTIEQLVQENALAKAKAVAKNFANALIIGSDTVIFFKNQLIGKPKNAKDAEKILKAFSGKWHSVYSGIALIETKAQKQLINFEETKVKFKKLSEKEILDYIATGEPLDKAGAYGIQGKGKNLIEKYEGSYSNIVGLPLEKLKEMMNELKIEFNSVIHN